jgi:hypothetical protein
MFRWLLSMSNETVLFNIFRILGVCMGLLYIQGLFVLELVTYTFMPDPSKGLKPMNVYSLAEKKALQDDLTGAIAEYEKVIAEAPDDLTARLRLAELCCENEDYKKAVMACETLLAREQRLDSTSLMNWARRSASLARSGRSIPDGGPGTTDGGAPDGEAEWPKT